MIPYYTEIMEFITLCSLYPTTKHFILYNDKQAFRNLLFYLDVAGKGRLFGIANN